MTDSLQETAAPVAARTHSRAEPLKKTDASAVSGPLIEPIDYDAVLVDYAHRPVGRMLDAAQIPPRPPAPVPVVVPPRPPLPADSGDDDDDDDDAAAEEQPSVLTAITETLSRWRRRIGERRPRPETDEEAESGAVDSVVSDAEPVVDAESGDPEPAREAPAADESASTEVVSLEESALAELIVDEDDVADEPVVHKSVEADVEIESHTEPAAASAPLLTGPAPEPLDGIPHALVVRGLIKRYGSFTALGGIDLTVPAGSFYGIVGPNGAGKTTTLSIVSGFLKADAGTVHIAGIDQAADPRGAKRIMGILPDRLRTFDRLTGRQLLRYYGLLRGLDSEVIDQRTADLARAFDLTGALGRVVSDYSAGMTKKLMLAGALIHSPRLLVLDEPFEAVDPVASGVILDILRAYVDHGGTVILSSHGMDLVERVCSRVAVIVEGELLAEGTVEELSAGRSLESRFVELTGGVGEVEGLEWLHTSSD